MKPNDCQALNVVSMPAASASPTPVAPRELVEEPEPAEEHDDRRDRGDPLARDQLSGPTSLPCRDVVSSIAGSLHWRAAAYTATSRTPGRRAQRVVEQHRDRHRPDPAGHRA